MSQSILLKLINFWPPYLGAGIRVKKMSQDMRAIDVEMKLRWWNKNYIGTQFGGSLYAMAAPFYMLMLIKNLGKEYIIWDKAATVRFKRPGKDRVHAQFRLTQEHIDSIRKQADLGPKTEPLLQVLIKDDAGNIIAEIDKTLHVRKKEQYR